MPSRRQSDTYMYAKTDGKVQQEPLQPLLPFDKFSESFRSDNGIPYYPKLLNSEPDTTLDRKSWGVSRSQVAERRLSSRDVRYPKDYSFVNANKYFDDDFSETDRTYTTHSIGFDESWNDPAIRWSQNHHDGVSPASPPLRLPSVHSRTTVAGRPLARPAMTKSTRSSLPPISFSEPSPCTEKYYERSVYSAPVRHSSTASAPPIPKRMPSVHCSCTRERSSRPPSRPVRAPTMHSQIYENDEIHYERPGLSKTSQRTSLEETLLEVAPGVCSPLRSSAETIEAIRNDFYVPTACYGCGEDLFCIEDAKYCLCPACKTISPLEAALKDKEDQHHGVGMGFTASILWETQSDFMAGSRRFSC